MLEKMKKIECCSKEIEDMKNQMNLWKYNKSSNTHVIRTPNEEEKEGEAEKVLKDIMAENFPRWQKTKTYRFKKLNKFQTG